MLRTLAAMLTVGALLSFGGGCTEVDESDEDNPLTPGGPVAVLEVHALDIWARPLDPALSTLEIVADGVALEVGGFPLEIPLRGPVSLLFRLTAPEHLPLEARVDFDGSAELYGLKLGAAPGHGGVSISHRTATQEGGRPRHRVHLGLEHAWFSSQASPPRRGNAIELHTSGETAWSAVRKELDGAKKSILMSTWWWQSDFELSRPPANHHLLTPFQRWKNTALGVLENNQAAQKRVLVGQFLSQDGVLSSFTWDDELLEHADVAGDGFEVMGQANPTKGVFFFDPAGVDFDERVRLSLPGASDAAFDAMPLVPSNVPPREVNLNQWPVELEIAHASYHQKFTVIDDRIAFVGGMNVKEVDWDGDLHQVFDHRRMLFDATSEKRAEVMAKKRLPDNGPRKDYILRIEGPAAPDVADVFRRRWQHQLNENVEYAGYNTSFDVDRSAPEQPGGVEVQITTTLPEPFREVGIAESWLKAIDNAQHYIYIEDQYFRAPMLNDRIKKRMQAVKQLFLVVITKPINEYADPGCAWTYQSHQLFATMFPGRYLPLQLRAFDVSVDDGTFVIDETDAHFLDVDIHSKMLIVDDVFLSVGSANKNNRGMIYEGEMNAAVLDPFWVREERRRILKQLLPKNVALADDPPKWLAQLESAAMYNDAVRAAWEDAGDDLDLDGEPLPDGYTPRGLLYSLPFGALSDCLFESVGPDQTGRPQ